MDEENGSSSSSITPQSSNAGRVLATFTSIVLVLGSVGVVIIAIYVARNVDTMPLDEIASSSTSLGMLVSLVLLSIFGLLAIWKENTGFIEGYFWMSVAHWFFDLGSTVVLLVVIHQKWRPFADDQCSKITPLEVCVEPYQLKVILFTGYFSFYKLIGAWTCYLIYRYRKELISRDFKKNHPILRWLKRSSASSISSIWKEKKWWSPSGVPVIKIDFASDQSSASSYSNDPPGYRSVAFGQGASNLVAPPQAAYMGDGIATVHDVPSLSYLSVGSGRR